MRFPAEGSHYFGYGESPSAAKAAILIGA